MSTGKKNIVILGGGFGGTNALLQLQKSLPVDTDVGITLINNWNFFLYTPMLPEVATGGIETRHVTQPLRGLCYKKSFNLVVAPIVSIDVGKKKVITTRKTFDYDYLLISLGSVNNFFGLPGVEERAFTLKNLEDSIRIRNHIVELFERANLEDDGSKRKRMLSFVVAGAGPAGVELVTEMHDLIYYDLLSKFSTIKADDVKLYLLEAGTKILPGMDEDLIAIALERINSMRIDLRLETPLISADTTSVTLQNGEVFHCDTLIWTAGMKVMPIIEALNVPKHTDGRLKVNEFLEVQGYSGVFAIGDNAYFVSQKSGRALPPAAQFAMRQGKVAARNILHDIKGEQKEAFAFEPLGFLVSMGKRFSIANILGIRLHGFIAWLLWRIIYLSKLVGFERKIQVAMDWLLMEIFGRETVQEVRLFIDEGKCNGCSLCVKVCPTATFQMKNGKSVVVNPRDCIECRTCIEECPVNCIEIK
ncbi:MAG TPA: FAD-dependent oxidoreductase [Candidatus Brocadiia bacterium]|nr:FAD-dependent oxidoreductase [Planctomycetota bacterium]MDO8093379.1 FAD-dependent oxidoreductase [Candidatus Brocadiales bacterium]